jgi:AcrR family transcriptional regulator
MLSYSHSGPPMSATKAAKSRAKRAQAPEQRRRSRAKDHIMVEPPPREPHQKRALETVRAILQAAGQLLVEQGFAKTSTNAIAARAGVSIGSLYQYFRNKDEVYVALRHQHFERIAPLLESLNRALALPRSDIADEIGKFVEALVRVHEPERDVIRAIDAELGWLESRDATSAREHQEWVSQVTELLAKRCPTLSSPLAAAHLLVAAVSLISRWMAHSAPSNVDRRLLIDGLERMIRGLLGTRTISH